MTSGYPTLEKRSNTNATWEPDNFLTSGANALAPTTYTPKPHRSPAVDPNWRKNPKTRTRRVSRAQETSPLHIGRGLCAQPVEADKADQHGRWLLLIQKKIARLHKRADATRNLVAVAVVLVRHADWETSCTTSLTWERIGELAGISRSVVKRSLRLFWQLGWIARIAPGRSAKAKLASGWSGDDAHQNDAPVYLLTIPKRVAYTTGPVTFLVAPIRGMIGVAGLSGSAWFSPPVVDDPGGVATGTR